MRIVTCKSCGTRVVPKGDGHCPSCQEFIETPDSAPTASAIASVAPSLPTPTRKPAVEGPFDAKPAPPATPAPVQDFEIVVPGSRLKAILFLVGGTLALIVGLAVAGAGYKAGFVMVLAGGIFVPVGVARAFSRKPAVVVNREGIFDNASPVGAGLVKWSEIRGLCVYRQEGIQFLGIDVEHPHLILARATGFRGVMARFEGSEKDYPISIPQTFLTITIDELVERIAANVAVPIRRV